MLLSLGTVDRLVKCEKWIRDDEDSAEESKATWWLNRLIGRTKKMTVDWPFPFSENKLFVLTLSAGLEGYHVTVDGRHVASFPYRTVSTSNNLLEFVNLKFGLARLRVRIVLLEDKTIMVEIVIK